MNFHAIGALNAASMAFGAMRLSTNVTFNDLEERGLVERVPALPEDAAARRTAGWVRWRLTQSGRAALRRHYGKWPQ